MSQDRRSDSLPAATTDGHGLLERFRHLPLPIPPPLSSPQESISQVPAQYAVMHERQVTTTFVPSVRPSVPFEGPGKASRKSDMTYWDVDFGVERKQVAPSVARASSRRVRKRRGHRKDSQRKRPLSQSSTRGDCDPHFVPLFADSSDNSEFTVPCPPSPHTHRTLLYPSTDGYHKGSPVKGSNAAPLKREEDPQKCKVVQQRVESTGRASSSTLGRDGISSSSKSSSSLVEQQDDSRHWERVCQIIPSTSGMGLQTYRPPVRQCRTPRTSRVFLYRNLVDAFRTVHQHTMDAYMTDTSLKGVSPMNATQSSHTGVLFRSTGAFSPTSTSQLGSTGSLTSSPVEQENLILSLTIHGMSPLHADVSVVHPFVRAWVVHRASGDHFVTSALAVPCAMTHPFDMKQRRTRSPWWEAEIMVPLEIKKMKASGESAVLLLEVLDSGAETIHGCYIPRAGLYPICWGFYLFSNCYGQSTWSKRYLHIQMYPFPFRTAWYTSLLEWLLPTSFASEAFYAPAGDGGGHSNKDGEDEPPAIFGVFKTPLARKILYTAGLVISFDVQPTSRAPLPQCTDMLPYEEYLLKQLLVATGRCAVPRPVTRGSLGENVRGDDSTCTRTPLSAGSLGFTNRAAISRGYHRLAGERSLPPSTTLQTMCVPGRVSCMSFSHSGHLLALGVTRNLQYLVEVRAVLSVGMVVVKQFVGHTGHIYAVEFNESDHLLLSSSSDRTVKVWRLHDVVLTNDAGTLSASICLCTLPHSFPVYCAIFHQEHIITSAGGTLFSWEYDRPVSRDPNTSMGSLGGGTPSLQLTATFDVPISLSVPRQNDSSVVSELVHQTVSEDMAVILSLSSKESSSRVWAVSSSQTAICWRATYEFHGDQKRSWQMSERRRFDCAGATRVCVKESLAMVVCACSPVVYLFHSTSCEQLRVINSHLPAGTPYCLLPDGEAFLAGTVEGKLCAWDCLDGGLCTPKDGYAGVRTSFPVSSIAWADNQHLGALCSPAPCPEAYLPERWRNGRDGDIGKLDPHDLWFGALRENVAAGIVPAEMTALAIVGCATDDGKTIIASDKRAPEDFCALFGGEVTQKRRIALAAARKRLASDPQRSAYGRAQRLYNPTPHLGRHLDRLQSGDPSIPSRSSESSDRMNVIIKFWKGLVGQHHHSMDARPLRFNSQSIDLDADSTPDPHYTTQMHAGGNVEGSSFGAEGRGDSAQPTS